MADDSRDDRKDPRPVQVRARVLSGHASAAPGAVSAQQQSAARAKARSGQAEPNPPDAPHDPAPAGEEPRGGRRGRGYGEGDYGAGPFGGDPNQGPDATHQAVIDLLLAEAGEKPIDIVPETGKLNVEGLVPAAGTAVGEASVIPVAVNAAAGVRDQFTATVIRAPWRPEILPALDRAEREVRAAMALAMVIRESREHRGHNHPPELVDAPDIDIAVFDTALSALTELRWIVQNERRPRQSLLELVSNALVAAWRAFRRMLTWLGGVPGVRQFMEGFFTEFGKSLGEELGKALGRGVGIGIEVVVAGLTIEGARELILSRLGESSDDIGGLIELIRAAASALGF